MTAAFLFPKLRRTHHRTDAPVHRGESSRHLQLSWQLVAPEQSEFVRDATVIDVSVASDQDIASGVIGHGQQPCRRTLIVHPERRRHDIHQSVANQRHRRGRIHPRGVHADPQPIAVQAASQQSAERTEVVIPRRRPPDHDHVGAAARDRTLQGVEKAFQAIDRVHVLPPGQRADRSITKGTE